MIAVLDFIICFAISVPQVSPSYHRVIHLESLSIVMLILLVYSELSVGLVIIQSERMRWLSKTMDL